MASKDKAKNTEKTGQDRNTSRRQSYSSSLTIPAFHCIFCVVYIFFWCFERLFSCFTRFGGSCRCLNFDKLTGNFLEPQSQTRIVGTLPSSTVFSLLACLLVLPMLFIAVNSPNLAHQHWEGKKTAKCPNNFDWDCSFLLFYTSPMFAQTLRG